MFEESSLAPSLTGLSALMDRGSKLEITPRTDEAQVTLSPVSAADGPFLYRTFASTRAAEMELTGWNEEQKESFLRMQYEAQKASYLLQLPDAEYWLVRRGDSAVGRLILNYTAPEIHVVDIAILPEFRAQGIGSVLMQAIMKEAAEAGKSVGLHVERFNPALHWYERLGFAVVNAGPIYLEMVWRPQLSDAGERQMPESESRVGEAYVHLSD